jgi:hypothetical protein
VPHLLSPGQKAARVEASKGLRILQESEANHFDGIGTADKFWFRHFYPCSEMVVRWLAEVIVRTQQAIGASQTMIIIFFIARKLILLGVLPKDSKFNQFYSRNYFFWTCKK